MVVPLISRLKYSFLLLALAVVSVVLVACASDNESGSNTTTVPTEAVSSTEPETSSATTTDTPVPGSRDGTFVVNDASEATFTVNEKLSRLPLPNDAVLRTNGITGEIDLSAETASLVIDLHSLESDDSRRDSYVQDRLFPSQSTATIEVNSFPVVPETFAEGEAFTSTVVGTVNVNGADADIEFTLESRLDPDRLLILVKGDFTWADFGMSAPTSNFFVVKDDVHVEVLVSAVPK
jgi:hypothetical protein